MKNWQRSDAQKVEGKGRDEDRECKGRSAIRDLERVEEEWRTIAKDRSWRLLIENVVRET